MKDRKIKRNSPLVLTQSAEYVRSASNAYYTCSYGAIVKSRKSASPIQKIGIVSKQTRTTSYLRCIVWVDPHHIIVLLLNRPLGRKTERLVHVDIVLVEARSIKRIFWWYIDDIWFGLSVFCATVYIIVCTYSGLYFPHGWDHVWGCPFL